MSDAGMSGHEGPPEDEATSDVESTSRLRRALTNPNVLSAVLAAAVGGGLAILGGFVGGYVTLSGERSLQREERQAAVRGAARQLDLELFARAERIFNAVGLTARVGDPSTRVVRQEWACAMRAFGRETVDSLEGKTTVCAKLTTDTAHQRFRPELRDTKLRPITWTLDDRRLLGTRLTGDAWFTVTTATDDWRDFAGRHKTVATLYRELRTQVEMIRELAAARGALAPYA